MLVIHVEIWPQGDGNLRRKIGQINIANDGSGTSETGNYTVAASHAGEHFGKPGPYKTGQVKGFRRALSPYRLIYRALKAIGEI